MGLILLNLDHLYFYDTPEFWKLIDHIMCRTAHDRGLRTHFPVMIELPSSADLEEIHDMGQFSPSCPVIVELPGFIAPDGTRKLQCWSHLHSQSDQ